MPVYVINWKTIKSMLDYNNNYNYYNNIVRINDFFHAVFLSKDRIRWLGN